ncbi:helix-turn-helix domain-containing protein [Vibrio agarivorans]|uniref:helix-turn-helix domain-containing protein n=1 Tax=Vibrio agarivorans TaxID=153622 RepID=UPI00222F6E08|nr:helix-turn-helix domain-containing protein [Vibrio agarivorans]
MSKSIKPVRLILGEPCRAIEPPLVQEEPFLDPHRHEYWEVVWCLDDSGHQSIDFVDYDNKKGRFFTISPGQVHKSDAVGSNVRLLVFALGFVETNTRSTQLVDRVFSTHKQQLPYLDIGEESEHYLVSIFNMIKDECARKEMCDWPLVESLINSFLRYMLKFAIQTDEKGEERDPRVALVIDLIEKHYTKEKKCQFYADSLALTNKRINEIVKADLGKTVTQLIHDRIMLEANRDLVFSTKTIKTIAFELGFEDPAYFSRFYRSKMNESPAEFRLRCVDSTTL